MEWFQSVIPKFYDKAIGDVKSFGKLDVMLSELKDLVLKSGSLSLLTPELLTHKFRSFETSIQKELAPLF